MSAKPKSVIGELASIWEDFKGDWRHVMAFMIFAFGIVSCIVLAIAIVLWGVQ